MSFAPSSSAGSGLTVPPGACILLRSDHGTAQYNGMHSRLNVLTCHFVLREEVEAGSSTSPACWLLKLRPTWSSPLLRCAAPRRDLRFLTAALRPSADVGSAAFLITDTLRVEEGIRGWFSRLSVLALENSGRCGRLRCSAALHRVEISAP